MGALIPARQQAIQQNGLRHAGIIKAHLALLHTRLVYFS